MGRVSREATKNTDSTAESIAIVHSDTQRLNRSEDRLNRSRDMERL